MNYSKAMLLFLLCAWQMPLTAEAQEATTTRTNIVLIVSDDHGREAVGCYGNKVVHKTNIDALTQSACYSVNFGQREYCV